MVDQHTLCVRHLLGLIELVVQGLVLLSQPLAGVLAAAYGVTPLPQGGPQLLHTRLLGSQLGSACVLQLLVPSVLGIQLPLQLRDLYIGLFPRLLLGRLAQLMIPRQVRTPPRLHLRRPLTLGAMHLCQILRRRQIIPPHRLHPRHPLLPLPRPVHARPPTAAGLMTTTMQQRALRRCLGHLPLLMLLLLLMVLATVAHNSMMIADR
mmetsp:Transcript_38517/g.96487  ORF Transcript_38517/g.96487 Transcript_38517/m.96487 type:complete len:207 (+) Transcript_38517:1120-1740(+)